MTPFAAPLNRRSMMALVSVGWASQAARAATPSRTPPSENLKRFVKMRGALDGRLVIGFLSGQYNGVMDGESTPMFGLFAATFSRYRPKGDGYEVIGFEQAYFTDLANGAVLHQWKNPYTGEIVEVPVTSSTPARTFITPDLRFRTADKLPANVKLDMGASSPEIIGDDIFFVERLYASRAPEGRAPRFGYNENTTLRAKLSDVDRADTATAPCQTSFDAIVSWRPWLKMGDRPGCMSAFGHGGYGVTMDSFQNHG